MENTLKEVLEFANQNPSVWMATTEGDQPRVRGMLLWYADESGFYFHTGKPKSIVSQLESNPKIEVGFIRNANDQERFQMLRVTGVAEMIQDKQLETRLLEERPWLRQNMENAGVNPDLVIFKVTKGSAYIWDMSNNLREDTIPRVTF